MMRPARRSQSKGYKAVRLGDYMNGEQTVYRQ